jgi:uncharacterized protein (DUF58 family)
MHRVRSIFLRADRLAEVALAERYGHAFCGQGGDLLLMVDVGTPGRRSLAADFAAVLAASAVRAGDRVGLVLFTSRVELYLPPSRDRNHLRRVIREILFFEPKGDSTDICTNLDYVGRIAPAGTKLLVISGFYQLGKLGDLIRRMAATNRSHDLVAVPIHDPDEFGFEELLEDQAGDREREEIDEDEEFAREAEWRRGILLFTLRSCGIDLLELSTDRPHLPFLMDYLDSRRMKRAS